MPYNIRMITVHHLNNSRSQRVLWLLEELGVAYEVKRYARDAKTMLSPPAPAPPDGLSRSHSRARCLQARAGTRRPLFLLVMRMRPARSANQTARLGMRLQNFEVRRSES